VRDRQSILFERCFFFVMDARPAPRMTRERKSAPSRRLGQCRRAGAELHRHPIDRRGMTRSDTLRKRAAQQAETPQRIVEAAVELHSTVGPSATTVSVVAERAGVQRHTYYAHLPDERSLLMACSGLALQRGPEPDPAPWRALADPAERLNSRQHALLHLAMSYYTWRALVRESGLSQADAVEAIVHAVPRAGEHDSQELVRVA
jgi:AcrR family transcriptional regulator